MVTAISSRFSEFQA